MIDHTENPGKSNSPMVHLLQHIRGRLLALNDVLGAHLGDPAAAPDPVAQRDIYRQNPHNNEDGIGREADALHHCAGNDRRCDDGKGHLEHGESHA